MKTEEKKAKWQWISDLKERHGNLFTGGFLGTHILGAEELVNKKCQWAQTEEKPHQKTDLSCQRTSLARQNTLNQLLLFFNQIPKRILWPYPAHTSKHKMSNLDFHLHLAVTKYTNSLTRVV